LHTIIGGGDVGFTYVVVVNQLKLVVDLYIQGILLKERVFREKDKEMTINLKIETLNEFVKENGTVYRAFVDVVDCDGEIRNQVELKVGEVANLAIWEGSHIVIMERAASENTI